MQHDQFFTYYRVSTQRQGAPGLGLDAQRTVVARYLAEHARAALGEFVEVETGKGANALERRPQLRLALSQCKKTGSALLIAKLDRLARNIHCVSGLIETGVVPLRLSKARRRTTTNAAVPTGPSPTASRPK